MKNFFKKLSFVLASAMVITSLYAPANAKAASKNFLRTKGSKKAAKSVTLFLNNKGVNFDYTFGKMTKGLKGTWKVSDSDVLAIGKKTGYVKAKAPGKATVSFTTMLGKKKVTVKSTVMVKAVPATALILDETKFDVKLNESLTVMPKFSIADEFMALGVKNSSDKLFASSDMEDVASVSVENNNLIIKGLKAGKANISFYAAASKDAETKVEGTKFEVSVIGDLAAEQTAANKITVKGKDLTKEAKDYEVKNEKGVAVTFKKDVLVNEDGTEAVLESDTLQIPEGKYTLTFKKDTTTELMVEKSRVDALEILPADKDVAVVSNDKKSATIYYRALDQFKNDVTKEYMARNLQITTNYYKTAEKAGEVTVAVDSTTGSTKTFTPNVDRISVSIVDTVNQKTVTKLLTVSDEARVAEVEYKGIWDNVKRDFVTEIPESADITVVSGKNYLKDYKLAFTAKDQYGNPFYGSSSYGTGSATNYMHAAQQVQVSLAGIPSLVADGTKNNAKDEELKGVKYLTYPIYAINTSAAIARDGNVKLNAIVINTGKTDSKEFEVVPSRKVNSLKIYEKATGVYAKQVNYLDYKALDKDGKEVTDWKNLKGLNPALRAYTAANGTDYYLKFVPNSKAKRVDLVYYPSVEPVGNTTITQVFSYVLPTLAFDTSSVVVRAERYPAAIAGIKDVARGATRQTSDSGSFKISVDDIKFQDQYGNLMDADAVLNFKTNNPTDVAKLKVWSGDLEKPENAVGTATGDTLTKANLVVGDKTNFNGTTGTYNTTSSQFDGVNGAEIEYKDNIVLNLKPTDNTNDPSLSAKINVALITKDPADKTKYKFVSTYTFRVYNVLLNDMYNFAFNDFGLKPAQDLDNDSTQLSTDPVNAPNHFEPGMVGYYDGNKIALQQEKDFEIYESVNLDKKTAFVPKMASIPAGKTAAKYSVTAYVHKSDVIKLSKEFDYSKEARRVNSIEFKDGKNVIAGAGTSKDWAALKTLLKIKDQYGWEVSTAPKMAKLNALEPIIVVSEFDDKEVTVTKNGSKETTIQLKGGVTSTEIELEIVYPYTSYRFKELVTLTQP